MRLDEVIEFVCCELGANISQVNEYTPLGEIYRDETEAAELLLALESEYGIEMGDEIDGDMTVGELVERIEKLTAE